MKANTVTIYIDLENAWLFKSKMLLSMFQDLIFDLRGADTTVTIAGRVFLCQLGQSIRARDYWCGRWNMSPKAVEYFFENLRDCGMIRYKAFNYFSTRIVSATACLAPDGYIELSYESSIKNPAERTITFNKEDFFLDEDYVHTEYQEPF